MTVWVVSYGNEPPGVLTCVYDNEAAALAHVKFWDNMVLDHGSPMLRCEAWSVQGEFRAEQAA